MKTKNTKKHNGQVPSASSGQVMMIVVMVLSAVMIGAVAVGGLLTSRQTRQAADAGSFSKASFAADAGLEWRLYKFIEDDYVCMAENCSDEGAACGERPFALGDDVLVTTCAVSTGSDPERFDYFSITSSAKYAQTSYSLKQEIGIIK